MPPPTCRHAPTSAGSEASDERVLTATICAGAAAGPRAEGGEKRQRPAGMNRLAAHDGERGERQGQRRQPHQQERPVADPTPLHRLIRDLAQEHQRGEGHDLLPLLLDQMNDHRDRKAGEADEKQRGEEGHGQRAFISRSRIDR